MYALIAQHSNGFEYYEQTVAVFDNESVAQLVRDELNSIAKKQWMERDHLSNPEYGEFFVQPIISVLAQSESIVMGIVDSILREHFPKRN